MIRAFTASGYPEPWPVKGTVEEELEADIAEQDQRLEALGVIPHVAFHLSDGGHEAWERRKIDTMKYSGNPIGTNEQK